MERILERFRSACEGEYLNLPSSYHTWEHALRVERHAMDLALRTEALGIPVDLPILRAACWGHDARYAIDPSAVTVADEGLPRPARCKEEVAAHYSARALYELGASSDFAYSVKLAIMCTNPGYGFPSVEGKILAAADLRDVGYGSYGQFLANEKLLREELAYLNGQRMSDDEATRGMASYLGLFTARRIKVTPGYHTEDGRSAWHMGAVPKICKIVRSRWANRGSKVIAEVGDSFLPLAAVGNQPSFGGQDVYVFIGKTWKRRRSALSSACAAFARWGARSPIMLGLPEEEGVISLPNGLLDELYVPVGSVHRYIVEEAYRASTADEWRRILRPGGSLRLYEKEVAGLGPSYAETGSLSKLTRWLKTKGFCPVAQAHRPFGWEAIYTPA